MTLSFRPSTPDDAADVHRVWRRSVEATHHFLSPEDLEVISVQVRDAYAPKAALTLALLEGRLVGFMGLTGSCIDALFVDPAAFGQGIGRSLIERARALAPRPLTLDVNEGNPGALAFYERMGFERVGRSETDDDGRPYPLLHLRELV